MKIKKHAGLWHCLAKLLTAGFPVLRFKIQCHNCEDKEKVNRTDTESHNVTCTKRSLTRFHTEYKMTRISLFVLILVFGES